MLSLHFQAGLTVFAVKKYRQGASEAFTSQYDPSDPNAQHTPSPYSSYPGDGAMDPYQQPPFSGGPGGGAGQQQPPMPQHGSEYQPPTYWARSPPGRTSEGAGAPPISGGRKLASGERVAVSIH